ncbi:MAG: response regulator, partial [Oligoflexia bacterium]|nr:response regulator [Oligoflexia bacterium]
MKILVVEDESVLRDLVSFMLESRFGGEILEASSGNRAIELLRNNPDIDLVICDYRMDDGTGGDVFRYLQEHHPSIKYILCTSGNPADYKEFQSSNAVIFFEKPFSADQLAEAIHRALGHEGDGALARPPRYCRIRTATILNVNLLSCDLYLKLSEGKY